MKISLYVYMAQDRLFIRGHSSTVYAAALKSLPSHKVEVFRVERVGVLSLLEVVRGL